MSTALIAEHQRIALRIIASPRRTLEDLNGATIGILAMPSGNTLGDDRAAGVFADMNHFGAGIGLLVVVGQGHRIKFTDRIVPLQNTTGIFPGDGRSGFHLCPGNFGINAQTFPAFGHEIIDSAFAVLYLPDTSFARSNI